MLRQITRRISAALLCGITLALLTFAIYATVTLAEDEPEIIITEPQETAEISYEFLTRYTAYEKPEPGCKPEPEYISLGIFTLTAYCPCVRCCGIWSKQHPSRINDPNFVQKTASGMIPAAGRTVAVDTNVIPFGTVLIIDGHEYVAEDRGGAIRGNRIDIYFETHSEAWNFGRQNAEVFIKICRGESE